MAEPKTTMSDSSRWVEFHGDALFRFAMPRVRDRNVAEDLVQDTFLAALRAKDRFAGDSSERTWLIAILRRKIVDHYRTTGLPGSRGKAAVTETCELESASQAQRRASHRDGVSAFLDNYFDDRGNWKRKVGGWPIDPETTLARSDFWRTVDDCLGKLPVSVAGAFCLREIEQLSTTEICQILSISATNLWTRIYRSRMWLRECLEKNWFSGLDVPENR